MKWKWKSSIFDVLIYPTNVYDKSHTCSGWATTSKAALPLGIWLVLKMYFPNNLACKKGTLPKLHSDICLVLNIQNQLVALKSSLKDCLFLPTSAPLLQTYTHQFKHALKSTNTFLVWLGTLFIRAYLFFRLRPQFDLSFTENYFKSNTDSNVVIYQLFWSAGFFLSLLPVRVLIKQKYPSGFLLKKMLQNGHLCLFHSLFWSDEEDIVSMYSGWPSHIRCVCILQLSLARSSSDCRELFPGFLVSFSRKCLFN